ncbi:MAG: IS110 family transposase [Sphingobacteriaceae bacterium]|nr:IS110 family transposase [Sphingobacteriaceae bacterium]
MKKVLKQVLGIDVAQKELVVTMGRLLDDLSKELYAHKVFKNSESGIKLLIDWAEKVSDNTLIVHYVMESTGVYHQKFAYYLSEHGQQLSIVLPNKISNYMRSLEVKTITDKTCSEAIARFGLERKLDIWEKPKMIYRSLQQLTRERDQIVNERSIVKNQLHAEKSEAYPYQKSLDRLKARVSFLNAQEKEIKKDISKIVSRDIALQQDVKIMCTLPGIGELTAVIVLAETNGFELIRSKKQLAGYSGFDVKEKLSGTSVKGKPKISKKGNRHLRKAMYLPSLSAVKCDERFKAIYVRILAKNGIKMKGLVAVQRKMLEMVYTLFKNKTSYDREYLKKENSVPIQDQYAITG